MHLVPNSYQMLCVFIFITNYGFLKLPTSGLRHNADFFYNMNKILLRKLKNARSAYFDAVAHLPRSGYVWICLPGLVDFEFLKNKIDKAYLA